MIPELAAASSPPPFGLRFLQYKVDTKQALTRVLEDGVKAWQVRSRHVMALANVFIGRPEFFVQHDSNTMQWIHIVYRTSSRSNIVRVLFYIGRFAGGGRILHTTESSERIRNERKINEFDAENLSDHDLGSVLEQLILDIVNKSDS